MTDWKKTAPKRAENAIKAIMLVAKTASKAYDVPPMEAAKMIRDLEDAIESVRMAYQPRLRGLDIGGRAEAAPRAEPPPAPRSAPLSAAKHIHQIAAFVASIPVELRPSYMTHLANLLCEDARSARLSEAGK
jgi:hypothetical protein